MTTFTQAELRIVSKIVQILRQDHNVQIKFQDPDLATKIESHIKVLEDPVLEALWKSLDRKPSIDKPAIQEQTSKPKMYRGQKIVSESEQAPEKPTELQQASDDKKSDGHYVTYRGKKTWVPH